MREYETVFITQPNLPDTQQKQLIDRLKTTVEKHEGRLFFARDMGKRSLAYPVGKQTKGTYTCLDYAAGGGSVTEIERSLRLDENVLRFLTVVKAEEVDIEARAAEVVARGEDAVAVPGEETTEEMGGRGAFERGSPKAADADVKSAEKEE
ncbi:MAG: 30S ribosomal protein S6 [Pseudomonadota bacterium]